MPKYHVCVAAAAIDNDPNFLIGGTELLSSIRPGVVTRFRDRKPIGAFEFPMDTMTMQAGEEEMTYDQMLAYVQGTGRSWWAARVYKNYTGLLDMYVHFAYSGDVARYVLDFDMTEVRVGVDYDGWPRPSDFYRARRAMPTGDVQTLAEYNAYYDEATAEAMAEGDVL